MHSLYLNHRHMGNGEYGAVELLDFISGNAK